MTERPPSHQIGAAERRHRAMKNVIRKWLERVPYTPSEAKSIMKDFKPTRNFYRFTPAKRNSEGE